MSKPAEPYLNNWSLNWKRAGIAVIVAGNLSAELFRELKNSGRSMTFASRSTIMAQRISCGIPCWMS